MDDKADGESNLERFDRYVMNDIPIRLIRLSDMKFVGRNDVRKHFRGSVPVGNLYPVSTIAKYAILSHRWLDEGEPTYEDMKSGTTLAGAGYEKLKKFCEWAQEFGMEFAWSDTCCIDKSSSTELDESIRSMFRWYRNSDICIVHLAQSETINDLMHDEWMERGWTLQELLAPCSIKFFNKHWMPMTDDRNDKSQEETEVMKTLERAAGIPIDALCELAPGPFSVDERMMWAARRKTTRVEDVAYSLMGIFDVSLQIAYGEGGDRAFYRLIESIMRAGSRSVLNWTGEPADHHSSGVIPRSPQSYVGRTPDLDLYSDLSPLEMAMTSLGLRVPLVIFPLRITSDKAKGNLVTAECLLCPAVKVDIIDVLWNTRAAPELALGIVNYSLEVGSLEPGIRGKSACFILQRYRREISSSGPYDMSARPRPGDFVGLKTVSPPTYRYTGWRKVRKTGLVKIDFPNIPSDKFYYISSAYLEIVYL